MIIRAITLFIIEPVLLIAALVLGFQVGGIIAAVILFCMFNLPVLVVKWIIRNRAPRARRESHAEMLAKFHRRGK